jgi:hypothetical protein
MGRHIYGNMLEQLGIVKTNRNMKKIILSIILSIFISFSFGQRTDNVTVSLSTFIGGTFVDSVTDCRAALQAAINYINSTKARAGVILVPYSNVYLSNTVYDTIVNPNRNTNIRIIGLGGNVPSYTTGLSVQFPPRSATFLFTDNATDTMFVVKGTSSLSFEHLGLGYVVNTGTPTNIGVYYENGYGFRWKDVGIFNFGINGDFKNGAEFIIDGCWIQGASQYNLRIQDSLQNDYGDGIIQNSWFYTDKTARTSGTTHILYKSGGGINIASCKFNGGFGSFYPATCIDASQFIGTVDMSVRFCSFENFTKTAFKVSNMTNLHFDFNQIGYVQSTNTDPIINFGINGSGGYTPNLYFTCTGNIIQGNGVDTAISIYAGNGISRDAVFASNSIGNVAVPVSYIGALTATNRFDIRYPEYAQTLTESGGKIFWDPNKGSYAEVVITGNDSLFIINAGTGQKLRLKISQSIAGQYNVILKNGSNWSQLSDDKVYTSATNNVIEITTKGISSQGAASSFEVSNISGGGNPNNYVAVYRNGIRGSILLQQDVSGNLSIGTSVTASAGLDLLSQTQYNSLKVTAWGGIQGIANNQLFLKHGGSAAGTPVAMVNGGQNGLAFGSYTGSGYITNSGLFTVLQANPTSTRAPAAVGIWNFATGSQSALAAGVNTFLLDSAGNGLIGNFANSIGVTNRFQSWNTGGSQFSAVYNVSNYTNFTTNSSGNLSISPTGGTVNIFGTNPLFLSGVQAGTATTGDSVLMITSGVVKKVAASTFTGGSTNIYNTDGTLTSNRTLSGGNFSLALGTSGSKISGLSIWSTSGVTFTGGQYASLQGAQLLEATSTINNPVTAASGTVSNFSAYFFSAPTVTSTNTSITYSNPATFRIENSPTFSTNSTATGRAYSLDVASGLTHLGVGSSNFSLIADGGVYLNGATTTNAVGVGLGASTTSQVSLGFTQGVDLSSLSSSNSGGLWWNGINFYFVDAVGTKRDLLNESVSLSETAVSTLTLSGTFTDYVFTGTTTTWTLPSLSSNQNRRYHFKNAGTGNITLQRAGSDQIYDTGLVTSVTITPGTARILVAGPSAWYLE